MLLVCENADNRIRYQEGERLHHLFEQRCDDFAARGDEGHLAVITDEGTWSFQELDRRANQTARYLIARGVRAGDRVGLLFDKTVDTYVALLAVLKVNAAYVPLDPSYPKERLAYILQDAGVQTVLSHLVCGSKAEGLGAALILLDAARPEIDCQATARLTPEEIGKPHDQLCYVIYTSGTTGNPKGVAIDHACICNFVRVAAEVYGYRPDDRVYQGMTIAFDFSVEELWVPLIAGATLVPGKSGVRLVGDDLGDYLRQQRVTALCCVPTLLATIERDLPDLRLLLVSGEACPQNLVSRWHRPGRTMLNAYGPTEATVTATLTELAPDKAVTIGGPLPTYSIVVLHEDRDAAVERGGLGEIGIAGIGLAAGYLNRPDLTARKFVLDFLGIPNNPSGRIYRTGDLGRINEWGEVEFHGRIDTQVKLRGYRIELSEIEAVLLELPQVGQAVVHTFEAEPGDVELVAYYTLKQGAGELPSADIAGALRRRLPAYMVPAYVERLPALPMTPSNKVDRKNLPAPAGPRFAAGQGEYVAPRNPTEAALAEALGRVLNLERVSVHDHFFDDLGAHSLLMAGFCAALRKHAELPDVSMRDVYLNPTVEALARHLGAAPAEEAARPPRLLLRIPTAIEYYGTGALQLLYYAAYGYCVLALLVAASEWAFAPELGIGATYLRLVACSAIGFGLLCAVPVMAKWVLVGRWKEEVIPIWGLRYFRFWVVKNLIRSAPAVAFRGSPIYNLYLRLLGARIGPGAVIQTRSLPVCTDLITVGANSVLRKDCLILGYKAEANYLYTGPVRIGRDAIVGEASVLDIDTAIGDGGQLGHASSLQTGQRVPAGQRYHGSPAQETQADYRQVEQRKGSGLRRVLYSALQVALLPVVGVPAVTLAAYYAGAGLLRYVGPGPSWLVFSGKMALASLVLVMGLTLIGLAIVLVVPRLLHRLLREERTYPLYGFHHFVAQALAFLSNAPFYNLLFGDSSFVIPYLRAVGYRLRRVVQTGANFGLDQRHDDPFLCEVGSGTMVSDRLTMVNLVQSASSFRLRRTRIGDNNYLGNDIVFPPASRTGANCLLGTKVMVPIDGPRRENVGLLGSPCFEIPRVVERDRRLQVADEQTRRALLRKKDRTNLGTMALLLFSRWLYTALLLAGLCVALLHGPDQGMVAVLGTYIASAVVFSILYFVAVERASLGFGRLQARTVSMYDDYFLFHERYWKLSGSPLPRLFAGTPFKNLISRLLGVRLGRTVFDDGCQFFDKTLLQIGDYANLNAFCIFQAHSLEEGVFKSSGIEIGAGCSVGAAAFVHYGVKAGDGVIIDPDSFVMKGEFADTNTIWRGNPARLIASSECRLQQPRAGAEGLGQVRSCGPEPASNCSLPTPLAHGK